MNINSQINSVEKLLHLPAGERRSLPCWELLYCLKGSVRLCFNDYILTCEKGQIAVVPPDTLCEKAPCHNVLCIRVTMQDPALCFREPFLTNDNANHFILDAFTGALYYFSMDPGKYSGLLSAYGSLIAAFLNLSVKSGNDRQGGLVDEICAEIRKNYHDCSYELDHYLRSFPYSYDYIRKLFKKTAGTTPHQYLLRLRLHCAAELLQSPEKTYMTVNTITRACGFRDPFYFSRMFKKKYGVSPSAFRSSEHIPDQPGAPFSADEFEE